MGRDFLIYHLWLKNDGMLFVVVNTLFTCLYKVSHLPNGPLAKFLVEDGELSNHTPTPIITHMFTYQTPNAVSDGECSKLYI